MADMRGKIALVTGANSGTGFVTALELAKAGATVVMLCRNAAKAEAARAAITAASRNDRIEWLQADLAEMADVRAAADAFAARHAQLDILVNNAGGLAIPPRLSAEGVETMFAGNYLGHFLLTNRLLGQIRAAGHARIINVSSVAHTMGRIHFDRWRSAEVKGGYAQSKLAQILFTFELADRLTGTGITVNAMHPGAVASGFKDAVPAGWKNMLASAVYGLFGITPEQGADTIVWLATAPEAADLTGKYFIKRKAVPSKGVSNDVPLRRKLWDESEALLKALGQPLQPW